MFRRMFWFVTGAATGAWATVKVNRALRRLSPESLAVTAADRALETGARLRLFARDVRAGMVQREDELHDALGLHATDAAALHARKTIGVLPAQDPDLPVQRRGIAYHRNRKDEH
jgi:hypothetical protein